MGEPAAVLVFGSINIDLVCRVETIARPGETVLSPRFERFCGGKGANQAVAAARILQIPGGVHMVGMVGDDPFGETARANLEAEGVEISGLGTGREPTGCAFISIDAAGENAITVASGANRELGASALDISHIGPRTVLLAQMEADPDASLGAAWTVRAQGGRVVFNLAPVPADLTPGRAAELLSSADVVIVNESEFEALAAALDMANETGPRDTAERVEQIAARAGICLVVTLGAEGALMARPGAKAGRVPAPPTEIVDTTGAGDTFAGALAATLYEGRTLEEAVDFSVAAASRACSQFGAQSAMPTRADLEPGAPV